MKILWNKKKREKEIKNKKEKIYQKKVSNLEIINQDENLKRFELSMK